LSRNHFKTLGARWVTSSNLNTQNLQIRLHHAQYITRSDQAPGFCAPFFYAPYCTLGRVTISYGLTTLYVSYYKPEYALSSAVCVTRESPTWMWQFSHSPTDMTYGRFCSMQLQLPIIVFCRRIMHGLRKHNYQVLCRFVFPGFGEAPQYRHAGLPPVSCIIHKQSPARPCDPVSIK